MGEGFSAQKRNPEQRRQARGHGSWTDPGPVRVPGIGVTHTLGTPRTDCSVPHTHSTAHPTHTHLTPFPSRVTTTPGSTRPVLSSAGPVDRGSGGHPISPQSYPSGPGSVLRVGRNHGPGPTPRLP